MYHCILKLYEKFWCVCSATLAQPFLRQLGYYTTPLAWHTLCVPAAVNRA